MYLVPLIFGELKNVDVIFFLGDILYSSKHKDVFFILDHGVASSRLCDGLIT